MMTKKYSKYANMLLRKELQLSLWGIVVLTGIVWLCIWLLSKKKTSSQDAALTGASNTKAEPTVVERIITPVYYYQTNPTPTPPPSDGVSNEIVHIQSTPLAEWVINHTQAFAYPDVIVLDSSNQTMDCIIEYISATQLKVVFDEPTTGKVIIH